MCIVSAHVLSVYVWASIFGCVRVCVGASVCNQAHIYRHSGMHTHTLTRTNSRGKTSVQIHLAFHSLLCTGLHTHRLWIGSGKLSWHRICCFQRSLNLLDLPSWQPLYVATVAWKAPSKSRNLVWKDQRFLPFWNTQKYVCLYTASSLKISTLLFEVTNNFTTEYQPT